MRRRKLVLPSESEVVFADLSALDPDNDADILTDYFRLDAADPPALPYMPKQTGDIDIVDVPRFKETAVDAAELPQTQDEHHSQRALSTSLQEEKRRSHSHQMPSAADPSCAQLVQHGSLPEHRSLPVTPTKAHVYRQNRKGWVVPPAPDMQISSPPPFEDILAAAISARTDSADADHRHSMNELKLAAMPPSPQTAARSAEKERFIANMDEPRQPAVEQQPLHATPVASIVPCMPASVLSSKKLSQQTEPSPSFMHDSLFRDIWLDDDIEDDTQPQHATSPHELQATPSAPVASASHMTDGNSAAVTTTEFKTPTPSKRSRLSLSVKHKSHEDVGKSAVVDDDDEIVAGPRKRAVGSRRIAITDTPVAAAAMTMNPSNTPVELLSSSPTPIRKRKSKNQLDQPGKRRHRQRIGSDDDDDSEGGEPSQLRAAKAHKPSKVNTKHKKKTKSMAKEFLDESAECSSETTSGDEEDDDGDFDSSFIDDGSQPARSTQNAADVSLAFYHRVNRLENDDEDDDQALAAFLQRAERYKDYDVSGSFGDGDDVQTDLSEAEEANAFERQPPDDKAMTSHHQVNSRSKADQISVTRAADERAPTEVTAGNKPKITTVIHDDDFDNFDDLDLLALLDDPGFEHAAAVEAPKPSTGAAKAEVAKAVVRSESAAPTTAARSDVAAGKKIIVVDSSTVSNVFQLLRIQHGCSLIIVPLEHCKFIVSNQCAVERLTQRLLVDRMANNKLGYLHTLKAQFSKAVILVERERDKGNGPDRYIGNKTYDAALAAVAQLRLTVLFSENQEDTAAILNSIWLEEAGKGNALQLASVLDQSSEPEKLIIKFLFAIPGLSPAGALAVAQCSAFKSISQLMSS